MNWTSIFIYDTTWSFAAEIAIRTIIMFSLVVLLLRLTGKRGVRQLTIFELTIILSLGSIAGDPMFTEDLPIIQAVLIMGLVLLLYRLCTWVTTKHKLFELLFEGKPTYIVENGLLIMEDVKKGRMSHDEFFTEMRQQGVRHLGQVQVGLLETDGEFSVLLFPDDETQYGLPIFPKEFQAAKTLKPGQPYACMHCGHVEYILAPNELCDCCHHSKGWAKALNNKIVN
ncbi:MULTISPECIES: DUF421 domain-containing protein [Psychrobacter]|uniref:DUF421 domain-containing protein n=1 Tax=Psychrobacter TaxID=497 RepID=UPI000ED54030|nr:MULTISPECIES: DUF421 domain-containing protein [Psychrobacter]HCN17041.1 DUF421 domain-containing protein [Psychrobacter sp.]